MAGPILGAGNAPAGTAPAGMGTPASGNGTGLVPFAALQTGAPMGSRLIDQATKRYVIGADGRMRGMNNIAQMVQIAVTTTLNSSSVRGLGIDLSSAQTLDAGTTNAMNAIYRSALADLINRNLIELLSVDVTPFPTSGAYVLVKWRDLSTGLEQTLRV